MKCPTFARFAAVALMVIALPALVTGQADLSGTWTLNQSKSTIPDMGGGSGRGFRGAFSDMVIKVEGETILITSTRQGRNGPQETTETIIPDGKPHTNEGGRMPVEVVADWKDGKLVVVSTRETPRGSFTLTASYMLAEDGTLVVKRERPAFGGSGGGTIKLVYDKKK